MNYTTNNYIKITTYNFKILFFRGCMKKSLLNKIIVLSVLIVVVLVLDLVTKYVFDGMYEEGTGVSLGIFNLIVVHNHGAAWGILSGNQVGLVILSLVFLAIFVWFYVKDKKKSWLLTVTFAFLCAGCIGNLYDRLVFGYVRDFIQFAFWQSFPVFNFADVFLTIGVVMFIIYLLIYAFKKEKVESAVVDAVGKIVIEEPEGEGGAKKDKNSNKIDLEKSENLQNTAENSPKINEFSVRNGENVDGLKAVGQIGEQSEIIEDKIVVDNVHDVLKKGKTDDKNE